MDERKKEKAEDGASTLRNVAIGAAATETVGRYGSASAEYVKAYTGIDNETGQTLSRGLKKIAGYSAPDETAIKQQAGFAAEVHFVADKNAENIIAGNPTRTVRTDDRPQDFGGNHPVYDHFEVVDGKLVAGSGSQMKFTDYKELLRGIAQGQEGKSNDLSRYRGVPLNLPSEQVGPAKEHCAEQARKLREQAERLERQGKSDLAALKRQQADNYDKLKEDIRDSGMTTEQALEYRRNPGMSTIKDIARTSHRAGVEGAKFGAAIGGAISAVTNLVAVMQDDKEVGQALLDTAVGTGKAAAVGYGTAFAGSAIKGLMQQSGNATVRTLSKTSLPAMAVSVCLEVGSAAALYARGEIDGTEFLELIGEKGAGMLAGGLGATLGQIAIPVPVLGGLIGGMVGYTLSSLIYKDALAAFKEAKEAREDYLRIKAYCEEAREAMEAYRARFRQEFDEWLEEGRAEISECLAAMDAATRDGRIDGFAHAANSLAACMGKTLRFADRPEFDRFMDADEPLAL